VKNIGRYSVLKCVNTFSDILYTLHEPVTVDGRQNKETAQHKSTNNKENKQERYQTKANTK